MLLWQSPVFLATRSCNHGHQTELHKLLLGTNPGNGNGILKKTRKSILYFYQNFALTELFCQTIDSAWSTVKCLENYFHSRNFKQKIVHNRVDHGLSEKENSANKIIIVHGESPMIIDKETSAFWRKILQPIEFVSVPEPGVRVPDGGHNLPSSQQQVSGLNTFRQSSY